MQACEALSVKGEAYRGEGGDSAHLFYAKQTQLSLVLGWKRRFARGNEPKRSQFLAGGVRRAAEEASMRNKANFRRFWAGNADLGRKTKPIKANSRKRGQVQPAARNPSVSLRTGCAAPFSSAKGAGGRYNGRSFVWRPESGAGRC